MNHFLRVCVGGGLQFGKYLIAIQILIVLWIKFLLSLVIICFL